MPAHIHPFPPFLLLLALAAGQPSVAQPCGSDSEEIPIPSDTLLYVDHQGFTHIFVKINEYTFKLGLRLLEFAAESFHFAL